MQTRERHIGFRFAWVLFVVVSVAACYRQSPLLSAAQFVSQFRDEQGRLPSQIEFHEWARRYSPPCDFSYYTNRPNGLSSWGVQGVDYVVGARLGTNALSTDYYRSWDERVFDGFIKNP
jgi:hypothetical protein